MAVSAGGDEPDLTAVPPDRLVAGGVRVKRVDLQGDELTGRRRPVALGQRHRPADEIALVPGDPPVHPGHARGVGLGELRRPDAEALLQPQRVEGVISVFPHVEVAAGRQQRSPQSSMIERAAVNLVPEFAHDRDARDPRRHEAHVDDARRHERHGGVGDVLMGDALEERPRLRSGDRKADHVVGNLAHGRAVSRMVGEPAHVPRAQVIGAFDPEGPVAPVDDSQVALELAGFREHRGELGASGFRQAGDGHRIEPALGLGAAHLIA